MLQSRGKWINREKKATKFIISCLSLGGLRASAPQGEAERGRRDRKTSRSFTSTSASSSSRSSRGRATTAPWTSRASRWWSPRMALTLGRDVKSWWEFNFLSFSPHIFPNIPPSQLQVPRARCGSSSNGDGSRIRRQNSSRGQGGCCGGGGGEEHLAAILMGIVLVFLICHAPRQVQLVYASFLFYVLFYYFSGCFSICTSLLPSASAPPPPPPLPQLKTKKRSTWTTQVVVLHPILPPPPRRRQSYRPGQTSSSARATSCW